MVRQCLEGGQKKLVVPRGSRSTLFVRLPSPWQRGGAVIAGILVMKSAAAETIEEDSWKKPLERGPSKDAKPPPQQPTELPLRRDRTHRQCGTRKQRKWSSPKNNSELSDHHRTFEAPYEAIWVRRRRGQISDPAHKGTNRSASEDENTTSSWTCHKQKRVSEASVMKTIGTALERTVEELRRRDGRAAREV